MKERTILIADDNHRLRDVLGRILTAPGIRVLRAADGRAVLDILSRERPDLVILDVSMPYFNGFQVSAILREDPSLRDLPILILTGQPRSREAESLRAGADEYMTKPFDVNDLLAAVRSLLARGRDDLDADVRVGE